MYAQATRAAVLTKMERRFQFFGINGDNGNNINLDINLGN